MKKVNDGAISLQKLLLSTKSKNRDTNLTKKRQSNLPFFMIMVLPFFRYLRGASFTKQKSYLQLGVQVLNNVC